MFNSISKVFSERAKSILSVAMICGSVALSGCSTTGSSSSNAPLEVSTPRHSVKTEANDVDAVGPSDVINRSKANVKRSGEIYLMRGLANVFSRGIDDLADKMRSKGLDASNFSYKYWEPIAQDIVARSKNNTISYPIIIIGHSLGGNESSKFANYLAQRGVTVDMVIAFDPVETGRVGKNIKQVINYYLPKDKTDNTIHAASDFTGTLRNIDVTTDHNITHTNVEKNARFQAASIDSTLKLTKNL